MSNELEPELQRLLLAQRQAEVLPVTSDGEAGPGFLHRAVQAVRYVEPALVPAAASVWLYDLTLLLK